VYNVRSYEPIFLVHTISLDSKAVKFSSQTGQCYKQDHMTQRLQGNSQDSCRRYFRRRSPSARM